MLLVEDEEDAARLLARYLRDRAFAVDVALDGRGALEKAAFNDYDVILLDVCLPDQDGFDVCAELRRAAVHVPILMLTALDAPHDRVRGLDSGADDYLGKPFDVDELCARIRALLRRAPLHRNPIVRLADLVVDTHQHVVRRDGQTIELTTKEYALLECLALRNGAVVGRAEIAEHVWDEHYDPASNLIEVYIQRLRKKIDADGRPRLLHTRRGEGYQLAPLDTTGA
jgi:two-component system copper resistance phosphate regulon response regulator CusR